MPCDYKYQTAFQPTQPSTEPKADHVIRCQEQNVATNTSFFRALSDEALLAIALARGAPDAGGPRAVGGRRRSERGDTRPSGSYVFYFVTWARARWSLGDNAVVRRRCRGFRRAWLPAGVGDASRRFSSTCCRETCFSHLAGLFHTLEPRSDCQAALRVGGAWRAL